MATKEEALETLQEKATELQQAADAAADAGVSIAEIMSTLAGVLMPGGSLPSIGGVPVG